MTIREVLKKVVLKYSGLPDDWPWDDSDEIIFYDAVKDLTTIFEECVGEDLKVDARANYQKGYNERGQEIRDAWKGRVG